VANHYIQKRADKYVIVQKGTGKVLSSHASKAKAQASFRAMEGSKHQGSKFKKTTGKRWQRWV
jgi:hypothetical protein